MHEQGLGSVSEDKIDIVEVSDKRQLNDFIDLAYRINADDPNWVPPIRAEVVELLTPGKNPFHEHARMQLFLAKRDGRVVGRISAHIDELALKQPPEQGMGPGTGNWGLFEAEDQEAGHALIAAAEEWLRQEGMTRILAPISQSIWEEPGILVKGHDHPPMIMMGHNKAEYEGWIENAGYEVAKRLITYDLVVEGGFPPLINRIVKSGRKNDRINIRSLDSNNLERESRIVIDILNDAWSDNWGFVPFTELEIAYGAKKLKPLLLGTTNMIAEVNGEPVAFMIALPDINPIIAPMKGKLLPFNWLKLLWWFRNPKTVNFRVPLMGVMKKHHNSRMASQLAFMMIEQIRENAVAKHGGLRAEIGWVLEDNQGMVAIANAIEANMNREYRIYSKPL